MRSSRVNSIDHARPVSDGASDVEPGPSTGAYARLPQRGRKFLEDLRSAPPLGSLTIIEERARMLQGQNASFENYPVELIEVTSAACPVYVIRPRDAHEDLPITFYLHGGGWVLGGLETHTMLLCQLALQSRRAIVFVDYPRAPETQFPKLVHVCEEAIQDTLRVAAELRLLADGFVLAGDSSGGNIALSYILALQRTGHAAPAALVLLYPVTDHAMDSASYIEFADNPNLSRQAMAWFWEQYIPEAPVRDDALASPLRAGVESFHAFPPTLIVTCEYDVLRDQGEALAMKLVQAGVEVTAVRWLGALHGFLVTEDLLSGPAAQRCVDFVAQYCRRLNGACRE